MLILSLLLFAGVRLWWRYRRIEPSRADVRVLAGLAVGAPLLHLALDFTLFQLARVPYAVPRADGWTVGDLRYDREPGLGFAEVEVGPGADECPALPAPSVPLREELLDGGG